MTNGDIAYTKFIGSPARNLLSIMQYKMKWRFLAALGIMTRNACLEDSFQEKTSDASFAIQYVFI
jgi:hypothetical protein